MPRDILLKAVADIVGDYREGDLPKIDANHVDRWIRQFPATTQEPILKELAHVLSGTYFTKENIVEFIKGIVANEKLTGGDPCAFWPGVKFLNLQTAGNSQRDMLTIFRAALRAKCGISINDCGAKPHTYLYLDDVLFSGGRIKTDLIAWIKSDAPKNAKVAVITIGIHKLGQWFAETDIKKAAEAAGKTIVLEWWRVVEIEDRKINIDNSDVLRPSMLPADQATLTYVAGLGAEPILRTPGNVGPLGLFSSDAGRTLLEQEFLKAGVGVRASCPHLNTYMRPLGNSMMKMMGFGSMIVTYRNCPNNAPLVLWAGDPWYPLFPRKTN